MLTSQQILITINMNDINERILRFSTNAEINRICYIFENLQISGELSLASSEITLII